MPFSFVQENGGVTSGVIDLLVKRADETIWALDYKTDRICPNGEGKILEKYRPQLTVYSQAAQKLFPAKKVVCSVVLLRTFAALDL
jgi:ATP-dependent exoDNAse (exonuclease V) beta subunit